MNQPDAENEEGGVPYRRGATRIDAELDIGFGSDNNFYTGFSENISEGGIFIVSYEARKLGDRLIVRFTLPGYDHPIEVTAEVKWVRERDEASDTKPGYGLQFVDLGESDREVIERFIRKRAPMFFDA